MADSLTKAKRSALMSRVRNKDTSIERYVRRAVWHAGFRYRLNVRGLPGAPDIALRRYLAAVFVQGCFWHGHSCRKGRRRPSANRDYWARKLDGNIARDARNHAELRQLGWRVFVVWECRLREDTEALVGWLKDLKSELERTSVVGNLCISNYSPDD